MQLFPNERSLIKLNDGLVHLTTHRVRYDDGRKVVSLTLEAVSSCGIVAHSKPFLMLSATFAAVGWIIEAQRSSMGFFGPNFVLRLLAVGLALAYVLSRSSDLAIKSLGYDIKLRVTAASREARLDFIDAVEKAKVEERATAPAAGPPTVDG